MTLTTRDHTMLRAAYEAIYQGTPVIVSDWPLLRDAFDEGALHVDNTTAGIADAITRVRKDCAAFREGARRLRERKLRRWAEIRAHIVERVWPEAGQAVIVDPREAETG